MEPVVCRELSTPMGPLFLRATSRGLSHVNFIRPQGELVAATQSAVIAHLDAGQTQLEEYFRQQRRDFDLELDPRGTTFQLRVWQELRKVSFGMLRSYGEIARAIGRPRAVRAVGAANGANPLPIIVPCHRIVGANDRLTGYAGGLHRKRALLDHEGVICEGDRVLRSGQGALAFEQRDGE